MKKTLKFAVMAFAAVLTLAACEKKGGDETNPEPDPAPAPAEVSIDGKQWCFEWNGIGDPVAAALDLGVTMEGTAMFIIDGSIMGIPGYTPYGGGTYTITKTDSTSGKIEMTDMGGGVVVFEYKDLTDKTVTINCAVPYMIEDVVATVSEEKIEVVM